MNLKPLQPISVSKAHFCQSQDCNSSAFSTILTHLLKREMTLLHSLPKSAHLKIVKESLPANIAVFEILKSQIFHDRGLTTYLLESSLEESSSIASSALRVPHRASRTINRRNGTPLRYATRYSPIRFIGEGTTVRHQDFSRSQSYGFVFGWRKNPYFARDSPSQFHSTWENRQAIRSHNAGPFFLMKAILGVWMTIRGSRLLRS